jgi:hypothetical protein
MLGTPVSPSSTVRRDHPKPKSHGTDQWSTSNLRPSRVLVDHLLGGKVKGPRVQDPQPFGNHREGRDEILLGYILFSLRLRDDLGFCKGERDRF